MHQFIESRNWRATKAVQAFDAAFDELAGNGIVVIHHGPCCDTGVGAYLWGEVLPSENESGRKPHGYAFHNEQSSETVRNVGNLWLVCGAIPESKLATAALQTLLLSRCRHDACLVVGSPARVR